MWDDIPLINVKWSDFNFYLRLLWERMRTWRLRRFERLPACDREMLCGKKEPKTATSMVLSAVQIDWD